MPISHSIHEIRRSPYKSPANAPCVVLPTFTRILTSRPGRIRELRVFDNQFVHKGELLYVIDQFDFDNALRDSRATLQQRAADVQVKERQSERRLQLSDLATTPEQQQVFAGNAVQAKAAFEAAQDQVAQAKVNLKRTEVRSPVNGFVTNLLLRAGDYARQGVVNVSIIDTDSFWIDGYFEETKMARGLLGSPRRGEIDGLFSSDHRAR